MECTLNLCSSSLMLIIFLFLHQLCHSEGNVPVQVQLMIVNNCKETIWPGILGTGTNPTLENGGFQLPLRQHRVIHLPKNWSGRIWGRTGCKFPNSTGTKDEGLNLSCETGDCAGRLQCKGIGGMAPATVVEMTFGTLESTLHYYDVSLIDGFNLPIAMVPLGGGDGKGGRCGVAGCEDNLNNLCPLKFAVKVTKNGSKEEMVVGCKSACLATGAARYCCTGEFATPEICQPPAVSRVFKQVCPRAYSYPFDDKSGLKTCRAPRYVITFCPPN